MDKEAFSRDRPGKSSNLGEKLNTEGKAKKAAGAKLRSETAAQKAAAEKMRFEKAVFTDEEPLSAKVKQQKRYARKKPAASRAARMAEGELPEYWHYKGEIKTTAASSETKKEVAAFLKAAAELLEDSSLTELAGTL